MKSNDCILVCVREDKLPEKSRIDDIIEVRKNCSTVCMGCQASLIVSKEKNRHVWPIESFDNNHNHVMASAKSV